MLGRRFRRSAPHHFLDIRRQLVAEILAGCRVPHSRLRHGSIAGVVANSGTFASTAAVTDETKLVVLVARLRTPSAPTVIVGDARPLGLARAGTSFTSALLSGGHVAGMTPSYLLVRIVVARARPTSSITSLAAAPTFTTAVSVAFASRSIGIPTASACSFAARWLFVSAPVAAAAAASVAAVTGDAAAMVGPVASARPVRRAATATVLPLFSLPATSVCVVLLPSAVTPSLIAIAAP
mmetsp:Transcript_94386/g.271910  ORF Transcript_94386/g.271910 Transcript_94386/m.271910 type:complete len:238 (-) Transcript_94386:854-1567(-)